MDLGKPRQVVAAAGQLESRLMNEAAATLDAIGRLIAEAGRQRVELLVLPECAYPAYLLGSAASYRAGDHLPSEAFVAWLGEQARQFQLHIVCGYVEDTGTTLRNAAVLVGPEGRFIGRTCKRFLWHVDRDWFAPGDEIAAFDTSLGRIGIIICAEARVPEIIATLVADGAELIAMPTCWINTARQPGEFYNPQPEYLIQSRAREFGLPFICADKSGLELTTGYVGQSCIVQADGTLSAQAPARGEALIVAPVTLQQARPIALTNPQRTTLLGGGHSARLASAESGYKQGGQDVANSPWRTRPPKTQAARDEILAARAGILSGTSSRGNPFPRSSEGTDVLTAAVAGGNCMTCEQLQSFVSARILALEGAEVLCFDADDLPMLRTRALENRVFVIGAAANSNAIVGPDGTVLARGTQHEPAVARVNLAEASNKLVAPRTDIFAERRPEMYRF